MTDQRAGHQGDLTYHQRMVADAQRMTSYERALRAVIRPGDVVLDVGAGTGVLSIWAARLGARVHAVESMDIGEVVKPLSYHHGVADRVTVHRGDMRTLPIAEPVDVVVSECLGRMLADDGMLDAMAAAMRWLKPGGRVVPQSVDLVMAPVELTHFPPLDTWRYLALGLDLSPLEVFADSQSYAISTDPRELLAEAQVCGRWTPPGALEMWPVSYTLRPSARLRGLAGWFRATLAPGIELTNEPGRETHWQQLLFPVPAQPLAGGEVMTVDIRPRDAIGWRWSVDLAGDQGSYADGGLEVEAIPVRAPEPLDLAAEHTAGEEAFARGDHHAAIRAFARVAGRIDPRDPEAPPIWENLGIAYHQAGLHALAIAPLMRALDGEWQSREQSLRLLVDSAFRAGHAGDGARWLALYEAAFGPHPSGWERS